MRLLVAAGLVGVLALSACSGPKSAHFVAAPSPSPTTAPVRLAVTGPVPGATGVPVSTEVEFTVTGGTPGSVTLVDDVGAQLPGELRADGHGWVPAAPLRYATAYTATVRAGAATGSTRFTTMASPGERQASGLYLFDGQVYGTAMPIVVEFPIGQGGGIPVAARAAVEHRMYVSSDPPQAGAWHWDSEQAAEYRSKEPWKPGTKLTMRLGFEGLPLGNGKYGDTDRSASARISDRSMVWTADNPSKTLTATRDGSVVNSFPISLGKESTPSSSGNLVVMTRERTSHFVSDDPSDPYDQTVDFGERLTWGGEYIHAAPWSVGDQGVRNVSHGCVNLSTDNAGWVYENILVGDLIVVKGTERRLVQGNGWTSWDLSWEELTRA